MEILPKHFTIARYAYEESTSHYVVRVSDGVHAGTSEFYSDDSSILEFASQLTSFPKNQNAAVSLDCGSESDPRHAGFTQLRFYVHNASGHSALNVKFISRGSDLASSHVAFSFEVEAAAVNRIGLALDVLVRSAKDEISVEL